jgi:hypothetical protein
MEKLRVLQRGKLLYIKIYGKEWELILPEEKEKKQTTKKTTTKKELS